MQFKKALKHTIIWKSLNTTFTFFINLLLVRLMGAEGSGQFFYAITELSLVTLLIGLCLENGIVYYVSLNNTTTFSLAKYALALLIVQGLVSWLILCNVEQVISLPQRICLVTSLLAINYFAAFFTSRKWIISVNVIICSVNFSVLVLLTILFFGKQISNGFQQIAWLYTGGYILQALLLICVLFFNSRNDKQYATVRIIKTIFRFSVMVFAANLIFFLVTRVDYYFVEKYCSSEALGNYIQVSKIGQLFLLLPAMAAGIIFPYTNTEDKMQMAANAKRICRILTAIFLMAAVIIVLTGKWLFPWLFGSSFTGMYLPMLLLLPGILCLMIVTILSAYLDGINKLWLGVWANLAALVIVTIADWLFIPVYGINGAAVISSGGYFVCMALTVYCFVKITNSSASELFFLRKGDIEAITGIKTANNG